MYLHGHEKSITALSMWLSQHGDITVCIGRLWLDSHECFAFQQSHDHSLCIRPRLPAYNVSEQYATFQLMGSLVR